MEIEDQEGTKIEIPRNSDEAVIGRGSGFITGDRTVSRRHVAFELETGANQTGPRVSFEVLGRNPVWVRRYEDEEIRVFRSSETGELSEGDRFCLSGAEPNWFALSRIRAEGWETRVSDDEDGGELGVSSRTGSEFEGFDVSDIDVVKEFGFVVMGHEFDVYPKSMIRDVKRWDWFLEEDRKGSSDDDDEEEELEKRKKKTESKKRKKGKEKEDDDWTGESEDDKEIVGTIRKGVRPKYSTRYKDCGKQPHKDGQGSRQSAQKQIYNSNGDDDDEDDDDEDETLGGFVVGDDDIEQEEEELNGDDDEDEFVEDDEEDE